MRAGTCARGCRWAQHGNASGHCAGCHLTFYGAQAFDRHQVHVRADGRPTCLDPATAEPPKSGGRAYWRDPEGQWHCGCPPEAPKALKSRPTTFAHVSGGDAA